MASKAVQAKITQYSWDFIWNELKNETSTQNHTDVIKWMSTLCTEPQDQVHLSAQKVWINYQYFAHCRYWYLQTDAVIKNIRGSELCLWYSHDIENCHWTNNHAGTALG